MPPYDILRKLFATFGMDAMARDRFKRADRVREAGRPTPRPRARRRPSGPSARAAATPSLTLIPIIELCRYCPGMVTAMGVSHGPHRRRRS